MIWSPVHGDEFPACALVRKASGAGGRYARALWGRRWGTVRVKSQVCALLHNSGRVTDRSQSCLNAIEFALTQACPGLTYDSVPHI